MNNIEGLRIIFDELKKIGGLRDFKCFDDYLAAKYPGIPDSSNMQKEHNPVSAIPAHTPLQEGEKNELYEKFLEAMSPEEKRDFFYAFDIEPTIDNTP